MRRLDLFFGAVLLVHLSTPVLSQTQQGDIVGTIRDAQGSVVPDATVKIANETTGAVRDVVSDEQGEYAALGFFPGSYRVEVEKSGFKRAVVGGVSVQSLTKKRVDVALELGEVQTEITVTEGAPVITTEGATLNVGLPRVLFEKPMNNVSRSGWTMDPAMWATGSSGGYNALFLWGGAYGSQVEIQVEGSQQNISLFTAPQSIDELSIISGTPPAEYGRPVTTNATFRSGTNTLHGEYSASLKNPAVDAVGQVTGPKVRPVGISQWRHEFAFGGPVYIPNFYDGRNKSFFFFDYWRSPYKTAGFATVSIPSPQILNGDFSKYVDGKGDIIPVRDPLTGQPVFRQCDSVKSHQLGGEKVDPGRIRR